MNHFNQRERIRWRQILYRYINPCLALFNISDGPSAKVVYSCSELLCNISTLHKLPKAKLVPGRVTHDMPNHWATGVSVHFSCRVMTKLVALNQWNHQKHNFPQALDKLRRSDKNIRCGGYGVCNKRSTFTFASTRRVDMTGFDMKERDFRSGRQWSVRDQGQGFKGHQRSYRLCVLQPPPNFF